MSPRVHICEAVWRLANLLISSLHGSVFILAWLGLILHFNWSSHSSAESRRTRLLAVDELRHRAELQRVFVFPVWLCKSQSSFLCISEMHVLGAFRKWCVKMCLQLIRP